MRFAVVLALFWALISFAPDTYYCPMHCEGTKTYEASGSCPVCHMYLVKKGEEADENAPLSLRDYRVDLTTIPGAVNVGAPVEIRLVPRLTQNNSILRDLEEVHGTAMEVYLTTQELGTMVRIRPSPLGDGSFSLKKTFPSGGNYLLYALLTPKGKKPQVFPLALKVEGKKGKSRVVAKNHARTSFEDGVTLKSPGKIESGKKTHLEFEVLRQGKGGKKNLPVLKEFAYVVFVSQDTTRFIPVHTAIKETTKGKSHFEADVLFPKPGAYTVFLELWNVDEMAALQLGVE